MAIWVPHRRSDELLGFLSSWALRKVCYVQIWHAHFLATPTASAIPSISLPVALIECRDSNDFIEVTVKRRSNCARETLYVDAGYAVASGKTPRCFP